AFQTVRPRNSIGRATRQIGEPVCRMLREPVGNDIHFRTHQGGRHMAKSTIRALTRACVAVGTAFALLSAASAAQADAHIAFRESDVVSDQPGHATITDPDVVNAWGLALSPTSPLWVANNGTNTSTLYSGLADGVTKVGLTVSIPGGA